MLISIKRFLDQNRHNAQAEHELLEAALQMGRMLIEALAHNTVPGREADFLVFHRTIKGLARKLGEPASPLDLLEVASDAVNALETYAQRTAEYLKEENEHMQSMVAMLTDTVAAISGQTDASVARLQTIEQQIERASGLDDLRALRASLEDCLSAVREAVAHQRSGSAATTEGIRERIDAARKQIDRNRPPARSGEAEFEPEMAGERPEEAPTSYVAVFRLQRAEHIASRFGESTRQRMLALLHQSLKAVAGPRDKLLRWKETAFVMFVNSSEPIQDVRGRLSEVVTASTQHYFEVGAKTAMLSVGIDWTVFPQAQCPSLDAVFAEVDTFVASGRLAKSPQAVY